MKTHITVSASTASVENAMRRALRVVTPWSAKATTTLDQLPEPDDSIDSLHHVMMIIRTCPSNVTHPHTTEPHSRIIIGMAQTSKDKDAAAIGEESRLEESAHP